MIHGVVPQGLYTLCTYQARVSSLLLHLQPASALLFLAQLRLYFCPHCFTAAAVPGGSTAADSSRSASSLLLVLHFYNFPWLLQLALLLL
jgi:hypothetical protein